MPPVWFWLQQNSNGPEVTTEGRDQLRNVKRAPSPYPYVMEQKTGRDSSSRPILDELI